MVALMGQARAQETSELPDQLDVCVTHTLPWLVYGYIELVTDPVVVVEGRAPPWLIYGGSLNVVGPLPHVSATVSPIRPDDD